MNTEEYIQTVRASFKASKHITDLELILPYLDELRKQHQKLQNQLEDYMADPYSYENPDEREKVKSRAIEIKEVCLTAGIQYKFFKLPNDHTEFWTQFKAKVFATYSYNNIDITDLVVFTKKKNQKINKVKGGVVEMMDEKEITLAELNFTEDVNAVSFIDTEDNKLPGE